ncbi:hypothetical protein NQ314_008319, partial [Rhamnusium bicolor]
FSEINMAIIHAIILLLTVTSISSLPAQPKAEDYRLPEIYSPTSYHVELSLTDDAFTATSNAFTGLVSIVFSFTNQTNYIALHAQHNFITIGRITFNNTELSTTDYGINNETDILKINLANAIDIGTAYTLVIEYKGLLSTGDMYGFYKSSYVDEDNATKYLATTQFESTYARRAFPCFDEPALKATFHFIFTFPISLNVLFNTPQSSNEANETTGLRTVVFDMTPKMPTYLIAFIISEFTCTIGTSIGTVPYQVCSRKESAATRELAVDLGPKLLQSLNNFTNYDYGRSIQKMDQVAIPDFAAGAMENWGLVTYRETALLWDKNESSNRYQQRVATVIAHEFTHQWFGNLVTCKWWSEIFLNEGFATYFEYFTTHEVLSDWELDKQFVIEVVHNAFGADALENAHALQSSCETPAEISSKFSTISYDKGKLVHWKIINLKKRFLYTGEDTETKWYVPVSFTTSVDSSKFETTTPNVWLTPTENLNFTLPENSTWIILNNQETGYYRVNYDDALWDHINHALLKDDYDGIIDLNRAQIVDDLFNIARANHIKYSKVFSTINFLANDTSYYSWYAAFAGYNFLLRRVGDNSPLGQAIASDILGLMDKFYASVPISTLKESDQIYTHSQVLALTWACRLGSESCVDEVQKLFSEYQTSGVRPNRNLRSIVYCNALRYSSNSSDWEFLWDAYTNAADLATEQVTILSALGCTKDSSLLTEYLKKSITADSGIRSQDALSVFSSVYTGNPEGVDVAFEFLMENYKAIAEK